MWPRVRDERLLLALMAGMVVLAWISLWIWKESPHGRFLSHEANEEVAGLGKSYLVLALLFVAGWTLMTVAMMLPTSLPLIAFFQQLRRTRRTGAAGRAARRRLPGDLDGLRRRGPPRRPGSPSCRRSESAGWSNAWLIAAAPFCCRPLPVHAAQVHVPGQVPLAR